MPEHISARTNKAILCQFHHEPPCDLFQFSISVVLGIDINTSFGAPKWHINHCTYVSQRSQSFYFIYTYISTLRSNSFTRCAVLAVLGPVVLR